MILSDLASFLRRNPLPRDTPLLFPGVDPAVAVGLETLHGDYHILSIRSHRILSTLRDRGYSAVSYEEETGGPDPNVVGTAQLILSGWVDRYVRERVRREPASCGFLIFKNSYRIEEHILGLSAKLLASPAGLAGRLEHKGKFHQLMNGLRIPTPATVLAPLSAVEYGNLVRTLGSETLVIQGVHGFSGKRTLLIRSEKEFREAREIVGDREVKISRFVAGIPVSLLACRVPGRTIVSYPFFQLTGVPLLTPNPLGACGNVWKKDWFPKDRLEILTERVDRIGESIGEMGYRGLFGLDLVFVPETGETVLIELNARMTATVPIQTKLQIRNGEVPLLALHVLAHLGIPFEIDPECFAIGRCVNTDASQLIFYSPESEERRLDTQLETGIYRADGGQIQKIGEGYSVDDLSDTNQFLLLMREPGSPVTGQSEYGRIHTLRPLSDDRGKLEPGFEGLVGTVRAGVGLNRSR